MAGDPTLTCTTSGEWLELAPAGSWTAAQSETLEARVMAAAPEVSGAQKLSINMAGVRELDTLGAWLLERLVRGSGGRKVEVRFVSLPERYRGLFDQIGRVNRLAVPAPASKNKVVAVFELIGQWALALIPEF